MKIRNLLLGAVAVVLAACGEGGDAGFAQPPTNPSSAGAIALGSASQQIGQAAGNVTVTVSRSGGSAGAASVAYATADGTATAGSDYTTSNGTLNWADGDAAAKTVTIPINAATGFDGTRVFTFTLSGATGATLGSPASTSITIAGTGAPTSLPPAGNTGTIALGSASQQVGQAAGSVTVTVSRSGGSTGVASVVYATANGTASAGTDYTASNGTLNWADGDAAAKAVTIPISTATGFDGTRSFTFTLSGAGGATLGSPASVSIAITGAGAAAPPPAATGGTLAVAASAYTATQTSASVTISVTRSGGSTGAATVAYATTNGTAIAGTDYSSRSGTLSWADGAAAAKTVTIPISAATGFDGTRMFTFTLSGATGATLGSPASASVTIQGAGAPGALALAAATYTVAQTGSSVTISVARNGGSTGAASVVYATADGTAMAGSHYTSASGTLSWAAGNAAAKTVVVPVSNAHPFTGSKSFTFTLSGATGATLGTPATATVTITGSGTATGGANSVTLDPHILVDQFGYRPNDAKVAVIRSPQSGFDASDSITPGTAYELRTAADGTTVFSGSLTAWNSGNTQASSGDKGWWFDFSSVTTPGSYFVYDVQRNLRSPTFSIDQQVYKPILKAALKMFFYQRSGFAKAAEYAGGWADGAAYVGAGQDLAARDVTDPNNTAKQRDLSGGWFDAGDTNQYVTFAVPPVHQLLAAYQNNPAVFTDDFNIPESGNGIPDVIDEVKWEIDWLKKMQFDDGSVALKLGTKVVENASPPSMDTTPRYYVPACTSSTIAAAGMFAHAAYVYGGIASLAAEVPALKTRAINAWNNYQGIATKQTNCDTGAVRAGDADRTADQQSALAVVAAVYLYAITGDAVYGDYVKDNYNKSYMRPYYDIGWSRYDPEQGEALLFYTTLSGADATVSGKIRQDKQSDVNAGNDIYGFNSDDLYRSYLHDGQYHWGSSQVRANYGNTNVDALLFGLAGGKDTAIQTRAVEVLHYFHGVNPFGKTYLTNMSSYGATSSMNAIFHAWYKVNSPLWGNVQTTTYGPPPGYVPGGPNASTSVSLSPPAGQPRQKAYRDWNGDPASGDPQTSWEITEPGIYYQSAYVKLVSAFAQ